MTRPPIAQDRLERRADGKLELGFKKVWRDARRQQLIVDLRARSPALRPPKASVR